MKNTAAVAKVLTSIVTKPTRPSPSYRRSEFQPPVPLDPSERLQQFPEVQEQLPDPTTSSWQDRFFAWEWSYPTSYVIPLILVIGIVCACGWLICACFYYTCRRLKGRAGRTTSEPGNSNECNDLLAACESPATKGRNHNMKKASKNNHKKNGKKGKCFPESAPVEITSELIAKRRQERLTELQAECIHLEQQLEDERRTALTSRASDSDLEYLASLSTSPEEHPLKRNSISLQDLPQSVINIRRAKELRLIKEEIESLKAKHKEVISRSPVHLDMDSSMSSPSPPSDSFLEKKVVPLSQHISTLKTQHKLNELRSEIEDLALEFVTGHGYDEKCSSLQNLPQTALNAQRKQEILRKRHELDRLEKFHTGERQKISQITEQYRRTPSQHDLENYSKGSFTRVPEKPLQADVDRKPVDPHNPNASIRRTREAELSRVRAELRELSDAVQLSYVNENHSGANLHHQNYA